MSTRIDELRRRVQEDPASIAFAQLAEECRRAGETEEAVAICRAGLVHHPDYLSARVTLGRALVELGRLDEAQAELTVVLTSAPDNLAANRALAEVFQKRGQLAEALDQYRKALDVAKFDPEIEHEVQRIENVVSPPPPPSPKQETPAVAIEDLFDFDTLLEQLGGRTQPKPEFPKAIEPPLRAPSALDILDLKVDDGDPFSVLERQLRESEEQRPYQEPPPEVSEPDIPEPPVPEAIVPEVIIPEPIVTAPIVAGPSEEELEEQRVLSELEGWLAAIVTNRDNQPSA